MVYFGGIAINLTTRLIFKRDLEKRSAAWTHTGMAVNRWMPWWGFSGVGQLSDFWPPQKHKLWKHKHPFILLIIWILSSDSLFSKLILEPTVIGKWKATWGWLSSSAGPCVRRITALVHGSMFTIRPKWPGRGSLRRLWSNGGKRKEGDLKKTL